jgi:hypothetical protein
MATDLEAVAKWHEGEAARWGGIPAMSNSPFHTEAAAAIRAAMGEIAKLYCAGGCSCCRDDEKWFAAADVLGRLIGATRYSDNSGYDFRAFRDAADAAQVRP